MSTKIHDVMPELEPEPHDAAVPHAAVLMVIRTEVPVTVMVGVPPPCKLVV